MTRDLVGREIGREPAKQKTAAPACANIPNRSNRYAIELRQIDGAQGRSSNAHHVGRRKQRARMVRVPSRLLRREAEVAMFRSARPIAKFRMQGETSPMLPRRRIFLRGRGQWGAPRSIRSRAFGGPLDRVIVVRCFLQNVVHCYQKRAAWSQSGKGLPCNRQSNCRRLDNVGLATRILSLRRAAVNHRRGWPRRRGIRANCRLRPPVPRGRILFGRSGSRPAQSAVR